MIKYEQDYNEYRQDSALGSTDISNINKSLRHFHDARQNNHTTNAMTLGSMIHILVLQPEIFDDTYAVYTGSKTAASKEYKEFCIENSGRTVIKETMYNLGLKALNSIKSHGVYQYLQNGFSEVSLYGEVSGVKCKGRLDYLHANKKSIFDIKTISEIAKWRQHVKEYSYHIQDYMYRSLLAHELEVNFSDIDMFFILIEKKNDSMYVSLRKMDEHSSLIAENQVENALNKYRDAMDNKIKLGETHPYNLKPVVEGLPYGFINSYFEKMEKFK